MNLIPQCNIVDGYKLDHISQYVSNTQLVYSNMTPRSDRLAPVLKEHHDGKMIFFGAQKLIKDLIKSWNDNFFNLPKDQVITQYARRIKNYVGRDYGDKQIEAMSKLHDLGYLPLSIKVLPEG